MPNSYFHFKKFTVHHDRSAMKVTTDGCLFGAWCAANLSQWQSGPPTPRERKQVLDIGTGTGLLSLMIAQKNEVYIDAVEIESEASEQAKENFASSPWATDFRVIHSDITEFCPGSKYDAIVSNPPFYEQELSSGRHAKDIAHHSLRLSLDQLLYFIKYNLEQDGRFFLLLPYKRMKEAEQRVANHHLHIVHKTIVHPSEKHAAFRIMLMGSNMFHENSTSTIYIKDAAGSYTPDFTQLLRDYYLNL